MRSKLILLLLIPALLALPAVVTAQEQTEENPLPSVEGVGGFLLSVFGGSEFGGSSSAQVGFALTYFNQPSASRGFEFEGAVTFGPSGQVYHGLLNLVLQTGARSSRIAPYIVVGGGLFHAQLDLENAVKEELDKFGIQFPSTSETGPMIDFGLGIRYFLSDSTSVRFDYREFRAVLNGEGGFFNRLFSLRRIAGMVAFEL